jgi:tRNA1Val (adenine37-N6)-methyltransferase
MSSINPHYTFQYSQPDSYRFSHDSVFLARRVFELQKENINTNWHALDLCAGCGIVGMDFLFHCKKELQTLPQRFDFLEIQSDYESHFAINKNLLNVTDTQINFLKQNYVDALPTQYDLILCNPPYFNPSEGQLSPNHFKNRCRFFIDASHAELVASIETALRPGGRAYVLNRKENPVTTPRLNAQVVGDIRGTPLVCYERLN